MSRLNLKASIVGAGTFALIALSATAAVAPETPLTTTPPSSVAPVVESAPRPSVSMSLEEAINIALSRGWAAKLQEISLLNSKESYLRTTYDYLPTLTVGPSANFGGTDVNVRTQGIGLTAGLSKRIAPLGATVSLNSTLLNISRRSRTSPTYSSALSLNVSGISLFRLNPRYNLNSLRQARVQLENSFLSNKSQYMNIVQNVENAYINVLQSRESLENARRSLRSAQTNYNETLARVNAGTATELTRMQTELTVLNSSSSFINAENSLVAAEDSLRTLLGGEGYDIGIIPTETITTYSGPMPTVAESYQKALANGSDYQTALKNMENTEASVYIARVNRLPNVTVGGSMGLNGSDSDFTPAWRDITSRSDYNWSINIGASIPVPMRNERSALRTAENNLAQARINLEQLRNTILINVRTQVRAIETNKRNADIAEQSLVIAERNYEAETERYRQGLSTYRAWLDSFNALESSRTNLLNSRVSLRNAVNNLRRTEGATLERFNIQAPE